MAAAAGMVFLKATAKPMDVLAKVTRVIPADRLIFGIAEPVLYARSNVLLLASPTLPDADKAMIARGNAAAMIR